MIVQEQHVIESYLFWDVFSKLTCYFLYLNHNICGLNKLTQLSNWFFGEQKEKF